MATKERKYRRISNQEIQDLSKMINQLKANSVLYAMLATGLITRPATKETSNAIIFNINHYDDPEHWQDENMNPVNFQELHAKMINRIFPPSNDSDNGKENCDS